MFSMGQVVLLELDPTKYYPVTKKKVLVGLFASPLSPDFS